jgi:hypothetical protein
MTSLIISKNDILMARVAEQAERFDDINITSRFDDMNITSRFDDMVMYLHTSKRLLTFILITTEERNLLSDLFIQYIFLL